jgi:hypothetical protein
MKKAEGSLLAVIVTAEGCVTPDNPRLAWKLCAKETDNLLALPFTPTLPYLPACLPL